MRLLPFFALLPLCSGAIATILINRTTIRFKFDDWQFYNKHVDAFQQPDVRVPPLLAKPTYGLQTGHQYPLNRRDQSTFYHILYTTSISIGTPPQPFTASVNLSWSDTFVPSVESLQDPVTAQYCREQNKYNSSLSSTYHPSETVAQIVYEGISTSGRLSQDILRLGGLEIRYQQFEEATFWQSMYANAAPLDSALGLAHLQSRTPASSASTKSALRNMLDQKVLSYISLPATLLTEIQTHLHPNLDMDDQFADLDCSMRDDLPDIAFSFSAKAVIVLAPWDYLNEVQDMEKEVTATQPTPPPQSQSSCL